MTTLSISSAFRHIAAAFGNERAQQKLAQQKSDRAFLKLISFKRFDPDREFRIPPFKSALPARTCPTLVEVKNLLKPQPLQQLGPASTAHEQTRASARTVTTPERRQTSAPTHETARVAPARPAPTSAVRLSSVSAAAAEGGWLHNHWKPSAAGVAALAGHLDTPDAPRAPAAMPAPTTATATAREEAGNARTFREPSWTLRSALTTDPFRIPRPTLTTKGTGNAAAPAPAEKQMLAARTVKVLETKEVIPSAKRRKAPDVPVTPQAAVPVAKHTSTAPARQKATPVLIAKPAMPASTTTAPAPPPPPLPLDLSPTRVGPATGSLFTELKNVTLAKSRSLDDNATAAFGTRTGDKPEHTAAGAEHQGLIQPKRNSAPTVSEELRQAVARRREKLGYEPEKPTVAAARPAPTQPQPKAADSVGTLIKPKPSAVGPSLVTKEQTGNVFLELQRVLKGRNMARGM